MTNFSFTLAPEFMETYADIEPDWGWRDEAGNSIGELTFVRTYSRLKTDGTKERWFECCERVVNGMFSIQKTYCLENRLPWDELKAQRSAREAFDRMFHFKWTPPGRGLSQMGTPLVLEQRNAASLQNCFTADTEFITDTGIRSLGEAVDQSVRVWTRSGWTDATVRHFGKQAVQRVTLAPFGRRSNVRVVETVTPDHRWELRDGSLTTDLKVGDVIPALAVKGHEVNDEAFRHGLIFADGSRITHRYASGAYGYSIRLCGDKKKYVDYFDNVTYPASANGDPVATIRSFRDLKALPTGECGDYLRSFIEGWMALDGRDASRNRQIVTQHQGAVEWLSRHAALAGFVVVGASVDSTTETNFGTRSAPLVSITLESKPDYWSVKSIEPLDTEEEVYCAVVPGVERFTLASGVYTSNCAFVSTGDMEATDPGYVFAWTTEALMLGIGVGFDTLGSEKFDQWNVDNVSHDERLIYVIPDTRQGWAKSIGHLVNSYLGTEFSHVEFDYSLIRPYGAPIATFGGTASGPEPLREGHEQIRSVLDKHRAGEISGSVAIVDIQNIIGTFVVAGNARRSAELALGQPGDEDFVNLKNHEKFPDRPWAFMSNNSISAEVGMDYSPFVANTAENGEPGYVWLDTARKFGRLKDPIDGKDYRVSGFNPCVEQPLESFEMCCLVEVHLNRAESLEDFVETLKYAYMYGKTVTLLNTEWEKTNAVMMRNRRIGLSLTGIAGFVETNSLEDFRNWADEGYYHVGKWDETYSEWFGVRESIRKTTVKPSGSVSLLSGATPGVHWAPGGETFLRAIRFGKDDETWRLLEQAGYEVEDDVYSANTKVVYFPLKSDIKRSEKDVSIYEKIHLAAEAQRYWSDNGVSVTVSFDAETESKDVEKVLHMYEGQLKAVSFLPMGNAVYAQQPYASLTEQEYEDRSQGLARVDTAALYGLAKEAAGEAYCTTDVCMI